MTHLKIFIDITRLNRPIGYMLLFWPCAWGLALGYYYNNDLNNFIYFLLLFFMGSVLMRSAGCIVNDIVDIDVDKKIKRTKNRPLASGIISIKQSLSYVIILCLLALIILVQFNYLTIALGMASMVLAFSYPFMKRLTYWPQLFLGLTFNWGIIMAWAAVNNDISLEILLLYLSAIFWTLGYDTIYGLQDIIDDEIIGMKSTAIKFKNNIKFFVSTCYFLVTAIILFIFLEKIDSSYKFILFLAFAGSLVYQITLFKKNDPESCFKAFKINNLSGLILFFGILSLNY